MLLKIALGLFGSNLLLVVVGWLLLYTLEEILLGPSILRHFGFTPEEPLPIGEWLREQVHENHALELLAALTGPLVLGWSAVYVLNFLRFFVKEHMWVFGDLHGSDRSEVETG